MTLFKYLSRKKGPPGDWQIFVRRDDELSAIFYAPTREAACKEAVTWAGHGDALNVLEAVLAALETALDTFEVPPPAAAAALQGLD